MTTTVLRTAEGWWVELPGAGRAAKVATAARTTAELLADRAALRAAVDESTVDVAELDLLSPITAPCRVVAQMVNYRSHARDSGFDPDTVPPTFFRKASGSISGPHATVVRPAHVALLDYEVELGLVLGAPLPVGTAVTEASLPRYLAGLVVANDISARDVQLTKGQFYESKSYPTFTPLGPRLVLLADNDFAHLERLRLRLWVNGAARQDHTLADLIVPPARALTLLARFQELAPGDLLLTGTPGGTALKAPPKPVERLAALLPPALKWRLFLKGQAKNTDYLQHGDLITASIGTDDGALDLGTQCTPVEHR
ncbi:fumarylacetoacetate hydrolase family protein [Crossiella cryophila]|uniref:2-keto-4-pentenoate hydratase/2-oxohepta-3-ene-1,7-dioic acid hydratase in catechol pathway n=1 Tax=Crossiella cryophila TaxID=43355 RepID=A0A7W7FWH7_9PSEU|nr:fumarylacetoacetate hydrolase family protein [Crossiella cryophila]MBB4680060.1 2-keto-4-pentenoate hydratase/2-oxohepta-3-ene-1,7-dioic acid hydratase in catechol pathway [Crossiella cryophila]